MRRALFILGAHMRGKLIKIVGFVATAMIGPIISAQQRPPNIVFLLADDLGWTDLSTQASSGGNGSKYHQTPNIDRLAREGMSFTNMHMCPNCVPSRAALMTGQYPVHDGVYNVGSLDRGKGVLTPPVQREHILPEAVTVAETLKIAGYVTAHVSKFHVANHDEITRVHGFDFNYGGGKKGDGGPHGYFAVQEGGRWTFANMGPEMDAFAAPYTSEYVAKNLTPYANENDPQKLVGTRKHLTDATADAAVDFISHHHDKPFFINVAFNAVHAAIKARPDLQAKWNKIQSQDPRHGRADYAALLEGEDQAIGRILHVLEDPNGDGDTSDSVVKNTLVILTSDNGGFGGSTNNAPLRQAKGTFYEGGLRVPVIARLPGVVKEGSTNDALLNVVDWYPTFADLAGAKLPAPSTHILDGESFAPILRGESPDVKREAIYYHFPGYLDNRAFPSSMIIKRLNGQQFKLFYSYEDQHYELYNLSEDLSEKHDLLQGKVAEKSLAVAKDLRDDLRGWLERVNPLYPTTKSGEKVPLPIGIDEALRAGNRVTRQMIAPKSGAD